MMETASLSGVRKAAILLTLLGEEPAATIFRNLSEDDLQRVADEVASLGPIPTELSLQVFEEYQQMTTSQDELMRGGLQLARKLLVKAFGEADADSILQRVTKARELNPREALMRADPQKIAKFLEGEHPQAIALVLGQLGDRQASALLMSLPAEIRAQAVKRLANLRKFSPEMAHKVAAVLTRRMRAIGEQDKRTYSGFQSAAAIMNRIDSSTAQEVLEMLENEDAQLAAGIRDLMFTFSDFLRVDKSQIRELCTATDKRVLATALKGASEEMKENFFSTMSSRAVEMLKEDMESMGPVRQRDVVKAQNEIVATARQLESEGKIVLKGDASDELIV
jgi:flagellar motor switch protein FliG